MRPKRFRLCANFFTESYQKPSGFHIKYFSHVQWSKGSLFELEAHATDQLFIVLPIDSIR